MQSTRRGRSSSPRIVAAAVAEVEARRRRRGGVHPARGMAWRLGCAPSLRPSVGSPTATTAAARRPTTTPPPTSTASTSSECPTASGAVDAAAAPARGARGAHARRRVGLRRAAGRRAQRSARMRCDARREVQEHSVRMGRTSQALRLHAWRCVRDAVGGEGRVRPRGEFVGVAPRYVRYGSSSAERRYSRSHSRLSNVSENENNGLPPLPSPLRAVRRDRRHVPYDVSAVGDFYSGRPKSAPPMRAGGSTEFGHRFAHNGQRKRAFVYGELRAGVGRRRGRLRPRSRQLGRGGRRARGGLLPRRLGGTSKHLASRRHRVGKTGGVFAKKGFGAAAQQSEIDGVVFNHDIDASSADGIASALSSHPAFVDAIGKPSKTAAEWRAEKERTSTRSPPPLASSARRAPTSRARTCSASSLAATLTCCGRAPAMAAQNSRARSHAAPPSTAPPAARRRPRLAAAPAATTGRARNSRTRTRASR